MSVLLQLNVHLAPGQLTREGHPFIGWCSPYHVEYYDDWRMLQQNFEDWRNKGVRCELGKMTARATQ